MDIKNYSHSNKSVSSNSLSNLAVIAISTKKTV